MQPGSDAAAAAQTKVLKSLLSACPPPLLLSLFSRSLHCVCVCQHVNLMLCVFMCSQTQMLQSTRAVWKCEMQLQTLRCLCLSKTK
eukprot:2844891-Rhodomonas_salina.1